MIESSKKASVPLSEYCIFFFFPALLSPPLSSRLTLSSLHNTTDVYRTRDDDDTAAAAAACDGSSAKYSTSIVIRLSNVACWNNNTHTASQTLDGECCIDKEA